jgi:hypothetical protein
MKANIDVKNRNEADAIRAGLEDPVMRATVIISGALSQLSERDRQRVLAFVTESQFQRPTPKVETAQQTDGPRGERGITGDPGVQTGPRGETGPRGSAAHA